MQPLLGKVAFVTGASQGIGRAIAEALAHAGADVAINYHSHSDEAEQVANVVRAAGRQALLLQGDVADAAFMQRAIEQVAKQLGQVDIAIANAAYSVREPFHTADMEKFRRGIDVTMWGTFNLFRSATQRMISQGQGGALVAISSPHAFVPVPNSMAYNMAKAAIDHMARTAAIELTEHRIRVNVIHPGWIDTPGERRFTSEEQIAAAANKLPWKRLGRPDEIARAVVFMCDPASEYITGSSLLVDGGITLPWWSKQGATPAE
jgi:glucose 1-dehydrogenase